MNIIKKLGYQGKLVSIFLFLVIQLFWIYNLPSLISNWLFFLSILLLLVTGIFYFRIILNIKCPKCTDRIFWNHLNGKKEHQGMPSPFVSEVCPSCGHDPLSNVKLDAK